MSFYKRKLPHWQPKGVEFFITFRLAGTLARGAIEKLKSWRRQLQNTDDITGQERIRKMIFQKYEQFLDNTEIGPTWLQEKEVADIVQDALHYYDEEKYDLYAYCIMPNHVHMVFRHLADEGVDDQQEKNYPITNVLHSLKSYTALGCNKLLHRSGAFWQSESYDRVIRNADELEKTIVYTLGNPVKAGFVSNWKDWPYSYCKAEFLKSL